MVLGLLSAVAPAASPAQSLFGGSGGATDTGTTTQSSANVITVNSGSQLFDRIFSQTSTPENGGLNLSLPEFSMSRIAGANVSVGDSKAGFSLGTVGLVIAGLGVFLLLRKRK